MPDYGKGKIYTIRCRSADMMIYVGSTIQPLCERWSDHKVKSKLEGNKNKLLYKTINKEWDNWYIELYELYPCKCREELNKREGAIIREIGTLNMRIEGRTPKEYREEHKEEYKKYREEHKEELTEYQKEYRVKYWEENKEDLQIKHKINYEKNKIKITCECGRVVNKHSLNLHKKSQYHTNWFSIEKALMEDLDV